MKQIITENLLYKALTDAMPELTPGAVPDDGVSAFIRTLFPEESAKIDSQRELFIRRILMEVMSEPNMAAAIVAHNESIQNWEPATNDPAPVNGTIWRTKSNNAKWIHLLRGTRAEAYMVAGYSHARLIEIELRKKFPGALMIVTAIADAPDWIRSFGEKRVNEAKALNDLPAQTAEATPQAAGQWEGDDV